MKSESIDSGTPNDSPPHKQFLSKRRAPSPSSRREWWANKKVERKNRHRQRMAARRAEHQQQWIALTEEEKEARRTLAKEFHEQRRNEERQRHELCARRFDSTDTPQLIFDLSYLFLMKEADIRSTVSQIKLSYSILRNGGFPLKPVLTSLSGTVAKELQEYAGFKSFPPIMSAEHWSKVLPLDRVVYLSADSDRLLQEVSPSWYYVVGAFVDHNRHKGVTQRSATQAGVRTTRLPLAETLGPLGNRCKVLTINHVTDVLTAVASGKPWSVAFEALPTRRVNAEVKRKRKTPSESYDSDG